MIKKVVIVVSAVSLVYKISLIMVISKADTNTDVVTYKDLSQILKILGVSSPENYALHIFLNY